MAEANAEYARAVARASTYWGPMDICPSDGYVGVCIENLHQQVSEVLRTMLDDVDVLDDSDLPG